MNLPIVKGYDCDGVLFNFKTGFIRRAAELGLAERFPASWLEWKVYKPGTKKDFETVWKSIVEDNNFWLDLPVHEDVDPSKVDADIYITARPCPSWVTAFALEEAGFPQAPVITVPPDSSKVEVIQRYGVDFFIEDNHPAFMEINDHTAAICWLFEQPANVKCDDARWRHLRIKTLDKYIATTTLKI